MRTFTALIALVCTVSLGAAQQAPAPAALPAGYPYEELLRSLRTTPQAEASPSLPGGQELSLFGHDFFRVPRELATTAVRLPEHYALGPGDRLGIFLTGKIQKELEVTVNLEGKIYVPPAGVLTVQGMTMRDLQQQLQKVMAHYFQNFTLQVMLIAPKPVQVTVVGEVQQPGRFTLTALNTVFDALCTAGGPSPRGSLRAINLYRGDSLFAVVDLYGLLTNRDPAQDLLLLGGDRLYVPIATALVAVVGEVKRPAAYELRPDLRETLADIVEIAGGLTDYALRSRVEVSRLLPNGERILHFVNLDSTAQVRALCLRNNDRVRVFSKQDLLHDRVVTISGAVTRPGQYLLEDNMHLSDLILKAGNVTRSADLLEAEVAKIDPKQPPTYIKVNLRRLLLEGDTSQDLLLEEDDHVFVREIPKWLVGPTVEVHGEVLYPGVYAIVKDSTTLGEIMAKCGGFTDEALIREARLIRRSAPSLVDKEYERLKTMTRDQMSDLEYDYLVMKENSRDIGRVVVDFYKLVVQHDAREDVLLEDGDIIEVPKAPVVVGVTGRVARPGGVVHVPGAKVSYYVKRAGGFAWDANKRKTKVIKVTGEVVDDEDVKQLVPGDIIYVPRRRPRDYWALFRDLMLVASQIATVALVIDNVVNRR
ncbi:MAG: SLBB domain-containing protein [bacterium]|jgi:protein involved in polysaccharide export with SLBB domain|nr:SLBB domain-containing protein [candidate division KSB1 bacterium]MDH7559581.1 SLBB domain-containing protein [bacterium]